MFLAEDDAVVDVQLLVVPDCVNEQGTLKLLRRALREADAGDSSVRTVVVRTEDEARELSFAGSPTILLDGDDPFPQAEMVTGLACRMYNQPGGHRGVPELAALVAAIRGHETARAHGAQPVDRQVTSGPNGAAAQAGIDIAAGR